MNGHLFVEKRPIKDTLSLSWDLAHHLYSRPLKGKVVIVADEPARLLAAFSKQWYRVLRQVERERSSTLHAQRILALTQKLANIKRVRFVAKTPAAEPQGDVFFVTPEALLNNPPICRTLYVTCPLSDAYQDILTSRMLDHGLVVLYS